MENTVGGISGDDLLELIERIERLETEKSAIQEDIKEVYKTAANTGYDAKVLKQVIRLRKMDEEKFREQEVLLAVYKKALGMLISLYDEVSAQRGIAKHTEVDA
jgi:uncharacterized protein (UPF0335 family)